MNILQKLTVRHLKSNRKRTIITIIGIVLSVAMLTAVSGFVVSFQDLLYRDTVALNGPWHVRYHQVSEETALQIIAEPVFSTGEILSTEDGLVVSLEFVRLNRKVFEVSDAICRQYGVNESSVQFHTDLLISKGIVPGNYFRALYSFAAILGVLVAIGSVLVISNAFTISADQRSLQFGLLKSTGATGKQVRGMVIWEGVVLALIAIPIGILTGLLVQWTALSIANHMLETVETVHLLAGFRVRTSPLALLLTIAAALLTIFCAAWFPAQKASKVSAVEAIRQTNQIKLSARQVRVSPLTPRLFGLEGMLAAKALGRNRGKYRATILSLVVSIVLFIGVSSFGDILVKATSLFYVDFGSNVVITMKGESAEEHNRLAAEMMSWDGGQIYPSRMLSGYPELPDGALTKEYQQYFPDSIPTLRLFSIGDDAFEALCQELRISSDAMKDVTAPRGILLNTSGTYIQQGKRIYFTPYHLSEGDSFAIELDGQELSLELAGVTEEIPPGIYPQFYTGSLQVIVSEETMAHLGQDRETDLLWLAVEADNAAAFAAQAEALLESQPEFHSWSVLDYESLTANNRKITALVMIFVYGFIALLTAIGVTSIITTISTSIALRRREFAMLRSVGMTRKAMARMLRYESLLYGIKALLWGIPIGLITCVLLYRAMTSAMAFPFIWPVKSILISIVAILAITLLTMAFARKKQQQLNIVDTLRHDTI